MRLIIETRRSGNETWQDVTEIRQETELSWDANGEDYIQAFAAFMFAKTFHPETIRTAMQQYVEDHDEEIWGSEEFDEEFEDEPDGQAEADEKTAPVRDGEGGY